MNIDLQRPSGRSVAIAFWVVLAAILLADGHFAPEITKSFWYRGVERVLIVLAAAAWLYVDALNRKVKPDNYAVFMAITPEITVLVYLIKTRGWRGFGRWLLSFVFALLSFVILLAVIEALTGAFHL